MYAIVDIAGQQVKVSKNQKMYVNRLQNEEGSQVEFDKVLLLDKEGTVTIGRPTVDGVRVAAKVLAHVKDDKVIVFKKKRRKGYEKLNGHRQFLSEILIQGILEKGETLKLDEPVKKATAKKETSAEAEGKETKASKTKKAAPKAEVEPKKANAVKKVTKKATKKK